MAEFPMYYGVQHRNDIDMDSGQSSNLIFGLFLFCLDYAAPQDYYEQRHTQHLKTQHPGHLKDIPRRFEIRGENAKTEFQKYIGDIYDLANDGNVTVTYKVKVEVEKPHKHDFSKKQLSKNKPKKYNIPLKKKNMKLSNFEIIMRKLADNLGPQAYPVVTTEDQQKIKHVFTTKIPVMKYKPILQKRKTNYTKIIKPVRNLIITLT